MASLIPQFECFPLPTELVLVNDGSTDETPELLAYLQRTVRVPFHILQGPCAGVAAARNLAASKASGTFLASFDDDQIALPGWLASLHRTAIETGAAAVGGALHLSLPPQVPLASLGPRTRSILGEHLPFDHSAPYLDKIRPATNNVLLRRSIYESLKGYNPDFTEGAEDADFFERVQAAGHLLYFERKAEAMHITPASRLAPSNLRWTSLRIGAGDARLHHRRRPWIGPMKLVLNRCAVALLRDLPQLPFASPTLRLNSQCSLWYTEGLLRALPAILLQQNTSSFLRSLNFRCRNGERLT